MAVYCLLNDIVENMKGVSFGASTAVTSDALNNMIAQESAVIESSLQSQYSLPILDGTALLFLKKICIDLVVFRVAKVLQPKTSIAAPDRKLEQEIAHESAYKSAMKLLKLLMSGDVQLPFESRKTSSNIRSTAVDNNTTTVFKHDEQQW